MEKRIKQALLVLLLIGSALGANAQQDYERVQKNTFYLELVGNGVLYSLNYDRILVDQQNWQVSGRIGGMYIPGLDYNKRQMIGLPLEVSYLRGRNKHYLEVGLGFTTTYGTYRLGESRIKDLALMGVARVGYRHQKREGGLFYKVGFTPVYGVVYNSRSEYKSVGDKFMSPLFGLAIGYTLKK